MGRLTNLRILNIRSCSVQAIPGLGELVALEVLVAQGCSELVEIPDFHKLSSLQKLDLQGCALRTERGLNGLEALECFSVQNCCELVALPELEKLESSESLTLATAEVWNYSRLWRV